MAKKTRRARLSPAQLTCPHRRCCTARSERPGGAPGADRSQAGQNPEEYAYVRTDLHASASMPEASWPRWLRCGC